MANWDHEDLKQPQNKNLEERVEHAERAAKWEADIAQQALDRAMYAEKEIERLKKIALRLDNFAKHVWTCDKVQKEQPSDCQCGLQEIRDALFGSDSDVFVHDSAVEALTQHIEDTKND